jgi:hypothetical protein
MTWQVHLHDEFELEELPEEIQDELLARLKVLSEFGPQLGRPNVDTLNGSSFPNMKGLGFERTGCGASPLHSTVSSKPLCSSEGTKKVKTKPGFTRTSSK